MAYVPKFCEETDVERYLSISISTATQPTTAQTLDFIEEVETGMLKRGWGSQTVVSGTTITVPPSGGMSRGSVKWFLSGLPSTEGGAIVFLPHMPIISVASGTFHKNKAGLADAPDEELLVCKDNLPSADDTDFLIVKEYNSKTDTHLGVALYFYGTTPSPGYRRLSGGWVYGYNVNAKILQEYATLKVSEKVMLARINSAQPTGLATYTGGETAGFVNTEYEAQLRYIDGRCEEIERRHLPEDVAIGVVQGV